MAEPVYSREQIEQWQQKLEEIAQKPRTTFTKKQAVEALIEQIEKALTTRSYEEVAAGLKSWGLEISAGSLKQYVTRYRKAHKTGGKAASRKRVVKPTKAIATQPPRRTPETVPAKPEPSPAILDAQGIQQIRVPSGFLEMDEESL